MCIRDRHGCVHHPHVGGSEAGVGGRRRDHCAGLHQPDHPRRAPRLGTAAPGEAGTARRHPFCRRVHLRRCLLYTSRGLPHRPCRHLLHGGLFHRQPHHRRDLRPAEHQRLYPGRHRIVRRLGHHDVRPVRRRLPAAGADVRAQDLLPAARPVQHLLAQSGVCLLYTSRCV